MTEITPDGTEITPDGTEITPDDTEITPDDTELSPEDRASQPMTTAPPPMSGVTFRSRSLRDSRFIDCDLRGVVVRGSDIAGMELDGPWLQGNDTLLVNDIDVAPFVDAELNRRFPGRELRAADDPHGLQEAWAAVEQTWATTLGRVASMPAATVDATVDGEWSVSQTLRHLVFATDLWLGKAVLRADQPFHPLGMEVDDDSDDPHEVDPDEVAGAADWDEVLEARADRQATVRDHIAGVTASVLAESRPNPHDPEYAETVLSCLHTILEEEWEHHRFVVRDLSVLERRREAQMS